jgi:hypothetical protein
VGTIIIYLLAYEPVILSRKNQMSFAKFYSIYCQETLDDTNKRIENIEECIKASKGKSFAGVSHQELKNCREALSQQAEDIKIIMLGEELEDTQ